MVDRNTSSLTEQSYTTLLSGEEFFLRDHVIGGKKLLPGVAYLEMAQAAGELGAEGKGIAALRNVIWAVPISLEGESKEVSIGLYPKPGGTVLYEVSTNGGNVAARNGNGN